MKTKLKIFFILFLSFIRINGQDLKKMSLQEAVAISISKSSEAILADLKTESAKYELQITKNNLYPNLTLSGQYLRLNEPFLDGALLGTSNSNNQKPDVNSLLLAQANFSMPLFQGFRLKNNVSVSENFLKSQTYTTAHTKEQIALRVTELFAGLYQANQTQKLFDDNLKVAKQREKDFTTAVENGLLAKNDFLKAQLQSDNIQLALDNAAKNATIINYKLVLLLQLPENTIIDIDIDAIKNDTKTSQLQKYDGQRNDFEALSLQQKTAETNIKIARSFYYPSINLVGGYIALDLKNALQVTNAMNVGVRMSYDMAALFKNNKNVNLASSKAKQVKQSMVILSEKIKEEIKEASENYNLSIKQNKVYTDATVQSSENYRIVKDKYDNGLSSTNDLLEADVQQLNSKINLALSEADLALRYYQTQFVTGNLLKSLNLNINTK